jgi:hypothetical protein
MGTPKPINLLDAPTRALQLTDLFPVRDPVALNGPAHKYTINDIVSLISVALVNSGLWNNAGEDQLGQNAGDATNPAKLLKDSEIPFNDFLLLFSGIGQTAGKHLILKYNAAAPANGEPFIEFQDSAGTKIAEMRFQTVAGGNNIEIGTNNGLPAGRNMYQIGTNIDANGLVNSRDCIFFGTNILAGAPASVTEKLIIIGHDSLDHGGAYGNYILILGNDVMDNLGADAIGSNIIAIGNFINNIAYPGGGMGNDLILIGQNIGLGGGASDTTIIGDGFVTSLSHIALIGTPTQNIIIGGALTGETSNGNKLQVRGNVLADAGYKNNFVSHVFADSPVAQLARNYFTQADTTGGNVIFNLDPAVLTGLTFVIKKTSADVNTVTLTPTSGTIQELGAAAANFVFNSQGQSVTVFCDGINFFVI